MAFNSDLIDVDAPPEPRAASQSPQSQHPSGTAPDLPARPALAASLMLHSCLRVLSAVALPALVLVLFVCRNGLSQKVQRLDSKIRGSSYRVSIVQ